MDTTDILLAMTLLGNSRLPYSELADKLNLSVNAVHRRVQALTESGIIGAFTAKVSLLAVHAVHVMVFGQSEIRHLDDALKRLGALDCTYWVTVAGGNYLYVAAYLRSIAELESYVTSVREEAHIADPSVGILLGVPDLRWGPIFRDATLTSLDYQIIQSLRNNARKVVPDVAEELGVSAKTVRRRLRQMIRDGSIELSIKWYPDASNDIMTIFHLYLTPTADKGTVGPLLVKKYAPNVLFYMLFSNLPTFMLCFVWTNTMKELRDIHARLDHEEALDSVVPNVLYAGYIFDTWRDALVLERGTPTRTRRTRD